MQTLPRGDISIAEEAGAAAADAAATGERGGDAGCVGGGGGGVFAAAAGVPGPSVGVSASSVELGLFLEPLRCCLWTHTSAHRNMREWSSCQIHARAKVGQSRVQLRVRKTPK